VHHKQSRAEQQAKATVQALGGGEVRIQGRTGNGVTRTRWRRANDPFPPRDKKH